MGQSWKIYWREFASHAYLYGSEIEFIGKEDIYFKNELMPPGTTIKTWFSKVNYQANRIEPSLPMIDGENRYRITADITEEDPGEEKGYLIRLAFFDRYGMAAGEEILRGEALDFRCPLKTYSYEVQLINAGTKAFHFHSMTMTELQDEEQTSDERTE